MLSPVESAKRVRAAASFAGLDHAELERLSGITAATLKRLVAKTSPRRASRDELIAVADACGVPERFMLEGFAPMEEAGLERRLAALETTAATLAAIIASSVSLESLEAEQRRFLEDWQRRSSSRDEGDEPESRTQEGG